MGHTIRSPRTLVALAVATAALLVLSVSAAFAQYPPGLNFGVTCVPENPAVGETSVCTVVGAAAGESLQATAAYGGQVFLDETLIADANGEATFSFQVPAGAEGAAIEVTVAGATSGTTGTALQVQSDTDDGTDDSTTDDGTGTDTSDDAVAGDTSETAETSTDTAIVAQEDLPRTGLETATLVLAGLLLLGLGASAVVASRRRTRRRVDA